MNRKSDSHFPELPDETDFSVNLEDTSDSADQGSNAQPVTPAASYVSPEAALKVGWRAITLMVMVGLAEALVLIGTILLLRAIIDEVIIWRAPTPRVMVLVAVLLGVALLGAIVRMLEFVVTESVGYRYVERLRMVMYSHLQKMPPRRLINNSRGAILLRFTGDLTMIRTWISRGIARGIVSTMTLVVAVLILGFLYFPFAVVVVGIMLIGTAVSLKGGLRLRRFARSLRRRRANLTTNLTEQIHSMASIQAFGRTAGEYDRFSRQNTNLTRTLLRWAWLRGYLRGISTATGGVAVVGVVGTSAVGIEGGHATVGTIVAAVLVVRYMMRPLRTLGLAHDYWQSSKVSREKILSFLHRPYRESDGAELQKLQVQRGSIEFQNVILSGSLHGITAEVNLRQIVAIMGPNGAGKTSLLSVVGRLADPDSGQVVVDGQVLTEHTLRSCTRHISIMTPMLPLLRGSLRRNLLYRWRDAPPAELDRVIDLCGLREVIHQLPLGLATGIKEGGANLAAGHAARVALARALVGQPKILLLDEPTASLDDATKKLFREVILRYQGTVLLVTHDPEEAGIADVVWKIEDGRIVETIMGNAFREHVAMPVRLPAWARAGDRR